jgi:hypothetical protein
VCKIGIRYRPWQKQPQAKMREGHSFVSAVQGLSGIQTNYSEDTAATFLGAAIGACCPDQISNELN